MNGISLTPSHSSGNIPTRPSSTAYRMRCLLQKFFQWGPHWHDNNLCLSVTCNQKNVYAWWNWVAVSCPSSMSYIPSVLSGMILLQFYYATTLLKERFSLGFGAWKQACMKLLQEDSKRFSKSRSNCDRTENSLCYYKRKGGGGGGGKTNRKKKKKHHVSTFISNTTTNNSRTFSGCLKHLHSILFSSLNSSLMQLVLFS